MVNTCAIYGCNNRANDDIKRGFYCVPTVRKHEGKQTEELSERRRNTWMSKINRKHFTPSKHTKVCSDHFVQGKPASLYETSHPDWAPSLRLGEETVRSTSSQKSCLNRYHRLQDRKIKQEQFSVAEALVELSTSMLETVEDPQQTIPCDNISASRSLVKQKDAQDEIQTEHLCDSEICNKTSAECQRLISENINLKLKLDTTKITLDFFKDNDKKVNYYTGLPTFKTLIVLFEYLENFIPESTRTYSALTKFQKLVLVLMKLRHNFPVQDLAYRFGVSQSTISRTFLTVIHIMYIRLQRYIYWPEREELRISMPMEFRKHFGLKVCVIIDCFEIFIERPSNLTARSKTWSSYKHHNTVKYLIGITPQGSVSFLSKGWGGRTSDKHITEHSGLLEKLLPGDTVLADRGFDISESVGLKCAEVKIPSFTKGRKQLPALDIESTRNIAHVRIHVERVIGLVRNKYTIMSGTLPLDYFMKSDDDIPVVDKIVTVCCCLTNLCRSVVPFN